MRKYVSELTGQVDGHLLFDFQKAAYAQLELEAVAANKAAVALYESVGFVEYGRNPRGFRSRISGWQELVLMRLELDNRKETKCHVE